MQYFKMGGAVYIKEYTGFTMYWLSSAGAFSSVIAAPSVSLYLKHNPYFANTWNLSFVLYVNFSASRYG